MKKACIRFGIAIIFIILIIIGIIYVLPKSSKNSKIEKIATGIKVENKNNISYSTIEYNEEVLLNPGKGWVAYENTDDSIYQNNTSIGYARYSWVTIEPQEGKYNWSIIDKAIEDYKKRGKKFSFGVMCANSSYDTKYITPKWVFDKGAKGEERQVGNLTNKQILPIWTDEIFLNELNEFVEALGERYNGNPNIAFIDIRSYGNWGEQHLGTIGGTGITSEQLKELYIKLYINAFPDTLLVNPFGNKEYTDTYKWAIEQGVSIRRDGIMQYTDGSECNMAYGKLPAIFEYVRSYKELKEMGLWSQEKLLEAVENGKPSYIQFSISMYKENKEFCDMLANKMGYYFRFKGAEYKNNVTTNRANNIKLKFINEGVAPLYEPCTIYVGLLDENNNLVKKYKTDIDPHKWMPNEDIIESIDLKFDGIEDGKYTIAIGLFLNENDKAPTYLLGNSGKTNNNWYVFGEINITNYGTDYQTISKTALENYLKFEKEFADQIIKVNGLSDKISRQKRELSNACKTEDVSEEQAKLLMKEHYDIGIDIIEACKQEKINVDFETLNSMLEMLNNIGNSYEELVTITAITKNPELNTVKDDLQKVENLISANSDLNMVYPNKILEAGKKLYQEAEDINSSQEENAIKTGMVISKSLHSRLLTNWANEFANLYIDMYIKQNPVKIVYSEINITNKDVTATLRTNANITILNNSNENTYVFKDNGTFVFKYRIKNREFAVKAEVKNIDKVVPKVDGIQNGKIYSNSVTPIVTDINLKKVELLGNGQVVTDYTAGNKISKEGIYILIAEDIAGNTTKVNFQIIENTKESYIIENSYIKNISGNTPKGEFEKRLDLKMKYTITRDGNTLTNDSTIATGDMLETNSGEKYTLIVTGDINSDGIVNIKDIVKMRKYLLTRDNLNSIEMLAADSNLDGQTLGIKDLVKMRLQALSRR